MKFMHELEGKFLEAELNGYNYIGVLIQMPNSSQPELIINPNDNFKTKLKYYKDAYSNDLTLKSYNMIKIIDVKYSNELQDFEDLL